MMMTSSKDLQQLLQRHNESLMLIHSEFQKLNRINEQIRTKFGSLLIKGTINTDFDTKYTQNYQRPFSPDAKGSLIGSQAPTSSSYTFNVSKDDVNADNKSAYNTDGRSTPYQQTNHSESMFDEIVTDNRALLRAAYDEDPKEENSGLQAPGMNDFEATLRASILRQYDADTRGNEFDDEEDEGFNSREFSSMDEIDESEGEIREQNQSEFFLNDEKKSQIPSPAHPDQEINNDDKDNDLVKATQNLKIQDKSPKHSTTIESLKKDASFLDSSSPNQDPEVTLQADRVDVQIPERFEVEPNASVKHEIKQEAQEDAKVFEEFEHEDSDKADDELSDFGASSGERQLNKLNLQLLDANNNSIDTRTIQSLKQLMNKSTDFVTQGLEINPNAEAEENNIINSENNEVLSSQLHNYNQLLHDKSNEFVSNLNTVINSFS